MRFALAAAVAALLTMSVADARTWRVAPGPDAQTELQRALNEAEPGDTVRLDRGRYELNAGLTLRVSNVTVRGDGADRTVLSFAGQQGDAAGLDVRANAVELRDFAVERTRGDGIAARGCNRITMRALRTEASGAYGLHAVDCSNVRIEDSTARGASMAGIGVHGSRIVILRRNTAQQNVVGLAIENTYNADVFENTIQGNAGGVLVANLPEIRQADGHAMRVFANTISGNNAANTARESYYAAIPSGTGVVVIAARDVHIIDNDIGDHGTTNVLVIAAPFDSIVVTADGRPGEPIQRRADDNYNPLPGNVMIRDNRFGLAGNAPSGGYAQLTQLGVAALPDVLWDGANTYSADAGPRSEIVRIVMRDNRSSRGGIGTFLSLGLNVPGAPLSEAAPDPAYPPLLTIEEPERVRLQD